MKRALQAACDLAIHPFMPANARLTAPKLNTPQHNPLPLQGSRALKGAPPEREVELRARAALGLEAGHRHAVRTYTAAAPDALGGFAREALALLGLPAETPVERVEVGALF